MPTILVSAGEASGDLYASLVVEELRRTLPGTDFFGCTGPRLRAAGVPVEYRVFDGTIHAFMSFTAAIPLAREALALTASRLRAALHQE